MRPWSPIDKWRRGFSGPADFWNGYRCCGHDKILFWDYTGNKVVPNVAKSWKISDDGRIFTVSLRKGMKWSDGHPFTADDFVFWYEDIYQNNDLVPAKSPLLSINGKPGTLEKVDETTIRFTLCIGIPNALFATAAARQGDASRMFSPHSLGNFLLIF